MVVVGRVPALAIQGDLSAAAVRRRVRSPVTKPTYDTGFVPVVVIDLTIASFPRRCVRFESVPKIATS
jgi:hypothetical protein